jgi:predicted RNA binding protein YcfA (HicA-like mRNA interferase family)
MTRLPRDISGTELVKRLRVLGYERVRQAGSHITCTTQRNGEHHVYVPNHSAIKVGTLHTVLKDIAEHFTVSLTQLLDMLGF